MRPVTVAVVAAPVEVPVRPPGVEVTVYTVIAAPPVLTGAVQVIVACVLPEVATTEVGAEDTVEGTTVAETAEMAEAPTLLLAVTVNV